MAYWMGYGYDIRPTGLLLSLLYCSSSQNCIKLVIDASAADCGKRKHEGFIRYQLKSAALMPHFNTRSYCKLEYFFKQMIRFHLINNRPTVCYLCCYFAVLKCVC